jgi:hypothetical protein
MTSALTRRTCRVEGERIPVYMANATADDFFSNVIAKPGTITRPAGSVVTGATVEKILGLNTPPSAACPHRLRPRRFQPAAHAPARHRADLRALRHARRRLRHHRANKLVAKTVTAGDVFTFPRGLV